MREDYKLTYANILETCVSAIYSSDEINEWCLREYGRLPLIDDNFDPMTPHVESDCPVVAFAILGGKNGQDTEDFTRILFVRVALSDNRTEVETDDNGRVRIRRHSGIRNVSHLLENLVYPCLCSAFNSLGYPLSTAEEEIEATDMTLYQASASLAVQFDKCIGEEVPFLV